MQELSDRRRQLLSSIQTVDDVNTYLQNVVNEGEQSELTGLPAELLELFGRAHDLDNVLPDEQATLDVFGLIVRYYRLAGNSLASIRQENYPAYSSALQRLLEQERRILSTILSRYPDADVQVKKERVLIVIPIIEHYRAMDTMGSLDQMFADVDNLSDALYNIIDFIHYTNWYQESPEEVLGISHLELQALTEWANKMRTYIEDKLKEKGQSGGETIPAEFQIGKPLHLVWDMRTQHEIPLERDSNVYLVVWRNQINDGLLVNLLHKRDNKTLEGYCQIDGTGQFDDITDGSDDITKIWDVAVEAGDIAGELLPLTITVTRKAEAGELIHNPRTIKAGETVAVRLRGDVAGGTSEATSHDIIIKDKEIPNCYIATYWFKNEGKICVYLFKDIPDKEGGTKPELQSRLSYLVDGSTDLSFEKTVDDTPYYLVVTNIQSDGDDGVAFNLTLEAETDPGAARTGTAEITTVALSTDIPEIPIPREVMERVMALGMAASNPSEVADALVISGATLRRWTSRFATELGVDMSTAVAGYPREYSRAQMILLANIRILLEQQLTYPQVAERIAALPQIAVTMPESTNALPAWAQERIDLAMADLGLSDQDSLRQAFVALAELGWRGAAVEQSVIEVIQQRAVALNIPVASQAVAGFSEYLLGVLAMRNGENVGDRLAVLRPHLGRWIRHNLVASSELLPFLRGLRAAPIISTLINTLANEGESGEEGVSISWDSLTRETMQSILVEVANRTTGSSPTDRIVHAAAQILGHALASNDSTIAAEMRTVASDDAVQQVLRTLAAELKSKQSE